MADVLERINLNVPSGVRARLRALATQQGRTESETARALLIGALDGALREQFYRSVAATQTPELSARDLQILRAFEKLDG
jgi:hypothetical protein